MTWIFYPWHEIDQNLSIIKNSKNKNKAIRLRSREWQTACDITLRILSVHSFFRYQKCFKRNWKELKVACVWRRKLCAKYKQAFSIAIKLSILLYFSSSLYSVEFKIIFMDRFNLWNKIDIIISAFGIKEWKWRLKLKQKPMN